jgi:hypothetical protein
MITRTWVLGLVLVLGIAGSAWAQSVHFKPHDPVFTDQGVVLLMEGSLAGLSNADITVMVTAQASATTLCTNRGGNKAPGQNPADLTAVGAEIIPASEVQNGQVFVSVTTDVPPRPTPEQAGCPSGNWTATIADLTFHSATVVVVQGGVVVLEQTFDL